MKHITIKLTQKETAALGNAFNHFLEAITSDQQKLKDGAFETTGGIYKQMSATKKVLLGILDQVADRCLDASQGGNEIRVVNEFFRDGSN
jgi:hypothetical protein